MDVFVKLETSQPAEARGGSPVANERLRTAMADARVDIDHVAEATQVDPKTVQRRLAGRVPHPRHRWKASELTTKRICTAQSTGSMMRCW
jgi:hypothetical protein